IEMVSDAVVSGVAALAVIGAIPEPVARHWLLCGVVVLGVLVAADFLTVHQTKNAELTAHMIVRGHFAWIFWVAVVLLGLIVPGVILLAAGPAALAALAILAGIAAKAHVLVQAPQRVPLS